MIQHTVAFRLKPDASINEREFLAHCRTLGELPGVEQFQVLRQVGKKSDFTHALSMVFGDQADYIGYNEHPVHQEFVETVWLPNVAEFHELDYVALDR